MPTIESIKDLGAHIRKVRKAQGLTQRQLADFANVGERFLSEVERGKETAEIGRVFRVLQTLGIDISTNERTFG